MHIQVFQSKKILNFASLYGVIPTFAPPAANRAQGTSATGQKNGIIGLHFDWKLYNLKRICSRMSFHSNSV
jgi:hypothetical protein